MDVKKKIKSLLSQAEIYNAQGLLKEAKQNYFQAGRLIKAHQNTIANHKSLLRSIAKKMQTLDIEIIKVEDEPEQRELPQNIQNIIKEKFAFGKDKEQSVMDGVVSLYKFGQFERALDEFKELLKIDALRLEAAKNIIRCYSTLDALPDAVDLYRQWQSNILFSEDEIKKLHTFFQGIINNKKLDIQLPMPGDEETADSSVSADMMLPDAPDENMLDISSVEIPMSPNSGRSREYDVSFQSGSIINFLISNADKELLDNIEEGMELTPVHFYSPIAMFEGKAIIQSKSVIEAGPKEGYYSIDIKIQSL